MELLYWIAATVASATLCLAAAFAQAHKYPIED